MIFGIQEQVAMSNRHSCEICADDCINGNNAEYYGLGISIKYGIVCISAGANF